MTTPGCTGPMCTYVGKQSTAAKGRCTQTNGYISNAEINEIIATNPTAQTFIDNSFSNILVYNETEWTAYIDDDNKDARDALFRGFNFAGTVDWATDLSTFHGVPANAYDTSTKPAVLVETWDLAKSLVDKGQKLFNPGDHHGNWSNGSITCEDPVVQNVLAFTSDARWSRLDCQDAYKDAVGIYREYYAKEYFTTSISNTFHGPQEMKCGYLSASSFCKAIEKCDKGYEADDSGPAGYEVLNSFIRVQNVSLIKTFSLFVSSGTGLLIASRYSRTGMMPSVRHLVRLYTMSITS